MFDSTHKPIRIFAGSSCQHLAQSIASTLNVPLGRIELGRFSDGETSVNIQETVRGCDVFIIQSTSAPANDNLMELLIMIDACKRASAKCITAVIPYFGYARQDRKSSTRAPISAKLVADILQTAGCNRILTMDLHSPQIQGFFNIPVDNLTGMSVLEQYFKNNQLKDLTIVSPDVGGVARSRTMARKFNAPMTIIDKHRPKANVMEVMHVIGDVKDKVCLIIDDIIDTAGTICQGAEALLNNGAKEVIACCTHAVLSGPAIERLKKSQLSKLVVLDTIEIPQSKKIEKMDIISVAKIFADAIQCLHCDSPITKLFE